MSSLDSYNERQNYEFEVLQSIFEESLQDMRKTAWNASGPLHVKLSLKPQQSMGGGGQAYVSLDMIVNCPATYPDEVPDLQLTNIKGVSHQLIKELKQKLDNQAAESLGEVMIWELANTVQEFLYKNNRPPEQSFHEQMMKNKEEELQRKLEQQRLMEEKERQKMQEEFLRHQAALKIEKQKRKDDHKNAEWSTPVASSAIVVPRQPSFSPTPSPILPHSPSRSKLYDDQTHQQTPTGTFAIPYSRRKRRTSTPKQGEDDEMGTSPTNEYSTGVTVLNFICNKIERRVNRGIFLGHSSSGSTVYAGMDASTGDLVAVAEWVMKWRGVGSKKAGGLDKQEDTEGTTYMKQVAAMEQEISGLVKLRHTNLIHYLALRHQYDPGKITVHILTEYSGGSNLAVYVHRKEQLPLEVLRLYTMEILDALKYLHKNSIVHKDLRPSSVFIDSGGRIRIGDYSIGKRLGDLYTTVNKARPGVHFSDSKPMVIGRGQKGDIYQLGLMLLTLILGKPLSETIPDIPKSLPSTLQDFLNKCLLKDERVRGTAAQLREHNFIKEPLQRVLKLHDNSSKKTDKNEVLKDEDEDKKDDENFEYLLSLVASGQSRLTSEFELIKVLGKGGFGDVLKVKNKLDGRFYAIKRIPINPKSKLFNKKMKREVKLLSRLNHENVVRYYCSWIEVSDDPAHSDTSSSFASSSRTAEPPVVSKKAPHIVKSIPLTKTPVLKAGMKSNQSLDPIGDIDHVVPQASDESVEWLTSFDHQDRTASDSSSDEEEDVFGSSFMPKLDDSDDSIVFGSGDKDDAESESMSEAPTTEANNTQPDDRKLPEPEDNVMKLLYIQMEYCEKSTLRTCIDDGLCQDMDRVWRLFREVIDGLVHIHEQGMIHRDLKPVNIFLDSNDHVKIGDFGLATTDILVKGGAADVTLPSPQEIVTVHRSTTSSCSDGNLTGKVGTALYVSPEVMQGTTKVHYDQKVDIYSLGIIFFEMCYKSLPTGMERVKIINNLRLPSVELPKDLCGDKFFNQAKIMSWLLNHDPSLRPTSKELASSDLLPPPLMQENELIELLKSTIDKPLSSSHRQMIGTIFSQKISPLIDITYDIDNYESSISRKTALIYRKVEETLVKVFTNHGAIHMPTPLFMPGLSIYEGTEQSKEHCVRLMDHKGGIVMVPLDHRVPFARYVGRCGAKSIKRYAIEKVFRERKLYNVHPRVHPRELTECSFDIITPSLNLIPDAEVLTIVQEIINEFPTLKARNYYIRISHIAILRAIFLHCGIPENHHDRALTIVCENYTNKQKRLALLESELKLNLSEQAASQLTFLLDLEGPLSRVSSCLRSVTKSMGQASSLCKSGLHDLEHILSYSNHLDLGLEVMINIGLIYNPIQFSGLMFQVICNTRKKKRIVPEVLAAGGRYDRLIEKFIHPLHSSAHRSPPHGVGISISFDRLVAVVAEDKEMQSLSPYDVVICSLGHQLLLNKKLSIAKTLWNAGFRTVVHYDKTEDFDDLEVNCREQGVSNIVILKDGESSRVKVLCLEQERTTDSIVTISELVDYLQRGTLEPFSNSNHGETVMSVNTNSNSSVFNFSIQFHVQEKGSRNQPLGKRRHEAMIAGKVTASFPWLPEKNVEVLALDIPVCFIKTIQAYLELGDEQSFEASLGIIIERSMKYRKYLTVVFDEIHNLRFKRKCNYIILYSMTDEAMRLLT